MNMEDGLNLTLGLPGRHESKNESCFKNINNNKRAQPHDQTNDEFKGSTQATMETAPATKALVIGWPPVRRNSSSFQTKKIMNETSSSVEISGMFVKVSMDGAPYLRKIDLKVYKGYSDLLKGLENMFKIRIGVYSEREGYKGSEYAPTYQDKDADWMLVGDVPWEMFVLSCKRMRIMKGSEEKGRVMS